MSKGRPWIIIYRRRGVGQAFLDAGGAMAKDIWEARGFGSEAEARAHVDAHYPPAMREHFSTHRLTAGGGYITPQ